MNVVRLDNKLNYFAVKLGGFITNHRLKPGWNITDQNGATELRIQTK